MQSALPFERGGSGVWQPSVPWHTTCASAPGGTRRVPARAHQVQAGLIFWPSETCPVWIRAPLHLCPAQNQQASIYRSQYHHENYVTGDDEGAMMAGRIAAARAMRDRSSSSAFVQVTVQVPVSMVVPRLQLLMHIERQAKVAACSSSSQLHFFTHQAVHHITKLYGFGDASKADAFAEALRAMQKTLKPGLIVTASLPEQLEHKSEHMAIVDRIWQGWQASKGLVWSCFWA